VAIKFGNEEFQQMTKLEREIEKALLPFRENTEAALAIFACCRAARRLLSLYPDWTQMELLQAIIPFVRGEKSMDDADAATNLILPSRAGDRRLM
jgi:hypothetical protein